MEYILITGASSGIGKGLAKSFAERKENLIIVARRKELLENLQKELESKYKIKVLVFIYDLSIEDNVIKFYETIKKYNIKTFINNAGIGEHNDPWNSNIKRIANLIDLNIKALTLLSIMFIKDNLNKNKKLINISSTVGFEILLDEIIYSSSKFFVSTFSEGIAKNLENKNYKLKVQVLAPSSTESESLEEMLNYANISQKEKNKLIINKKNKQKSIEKLIDFFFKLYESDYTIGIVDSKEDKIHLLNNYFKIH
ncbi:Serine 3-dehydrogenase [Candidatus Hepatoplasma crinochetorum Av]|uniref:Serine 3-dehydrogenase n=1 Tax=Candidatus Hepatoplasma crinochetorum Av TaxID=1427984 RepID=W8GEY9_9MOLU|nr:SDR family NAD(P)-dependent oxidoreductase [Candidatus Hepatoplasma crinochetorum]AHK22359.1 Serine 3-dehydrogenase [Candidatus Hepatoplasma crinochetorum Av]